MRSPEASIDHRLGALNGGGGHVFEHCWASHSFFAFFIIYAGGIPLAREIKAARAREDLMRRAMAAGRKKAGILESETNEEKARRLEIECSKAVIVWLYYYLPIGLLIIAAAILLR